MEMEKSHFGLVQVLIYFLAYKYLRLLIVYLGTITVVLKSSDLFSQKNFFCGLYGKVVSSVINPSVTCVERN